MPHETVVTAVVVVVGLLLVAALAAIGLRRVRLPYTVGLVLVGLALGALAERFELLHPLREVRLSPEIILFVFLPTLIFESAFNLDARLLSRNLAPVLTLAAPGLLLSTAIVGGLLGWWVRANRARVTKHRPDLLATEEAVGGARAALGRPEGVWCGDLNGAPLHASTEDRAVVLGPPGCGKSTLLRRYELDAAQAAIETNDPNAPVTFFIQLNHYMSPLAGEPPTEPGAWLAARWASHYPELPSVNALLTEGRMVLLLDALNEIPAPSATGLREAIVLGEGEYFALGDNSPSSSDGRDWGAVPGQNLLGKAFMVFWPALPWRWEVKLIR